MLEIPAFARRRSRRLSLLSAEPPASSAESIATTSAGTTSTRSVLLTKRLTGSWTSHEPEVRRTSELLSDRPSRSRLSLTDITRPDRKTTRHSEVFTTPSTPVDDLDSRQGGLDHNKLLSTQASPTEDIMSAQLFKTVAKKTSLKAILCDGPNTPEDQQGIDVEAAVKLLQELQKRATPDELVALHRALLPTKTADPQSDSAVSAFSRRSSITTPGLATRLRSPLRSAREWRGQVHTDHNIESRSGFSPILTTPKSFDNVPSNKGTAPVPRPHTPAGLDVSAIGGLKLGTLRVTNGAVSPEPSLVSEAGVVDAIDDAAATSTLGQFDVDEESASGTATPRASKASNFAAAADNPSGLIPGLDLYDDSSGEDKLTAPIRITSAPKTFRTQHSASRMYARPDLTSSVDSVISRLSTIMDVESLIEGRSGTPARALDRLNGFAETRSQPPSSSGSDGTSTIIDEGSHRSISLARQRPALGKKSDSGYASENANNGRSSSDLEDWTTSVLEPTTPRNQAKPGHAILASIESQGTLEGLEEASVQPPVLINPNRPPIPPAASFVGETIASTTSLPPTPSADQESNTKTPESGNRQRRKLYKPPPVRRSSSSKVPVETSSNVAPPSTSEDMGPNCSDEKRRSAAMSPHLSPRPADTGNTLTAMQSPATPLNAWSSPVASPLAATPTSGPPQKKKSRFRLRGRSRSSSMVRPETNLPKESDTPTVADTVHQYGGALGISMGASMSTDAVQGMNTTFDDGGRRSRSVPRPVQASAERRHSHAVSSPRQNDVLAAGHRADFAAQQNPGPPQHEDRSPAIGPLAAEKKERRKSLTRVFMRTMSSDGTAVSDPSPSKLETKSPAYIASRFSSPPPEPNRRAPPPPPQPRYIPWDDEGPLVRPVQARAMTTGSHTRTEQSARRPMPLEVIDANTVNWHAPAVDHDYRAYRSSDALSVSKLITSPTPDKQHQRHRLPHKPAGPASLQLPSTPDEERRRWSQLSSTTPSPDSLFDRYGGGLDYGWERGVGFSGSAGMRSSVGVRGSRRSEVLHGLEGVDLSDVPVFMVSK